MTTATAALNRNRNRSTGLDESSDFMGLPFELRYVISAIHDAAGCYRPRGSVHPNRGCSALHPAKEADSRSVSYEAARLRDPRQIRRRAQGAPPIRSSDERPR